MGNEDAEIRRMKRQLARTLILGAVALAIAVGLMLAGFKLNAENQKTDSLPQVPTTLALRD